MVVDPELCTRETFQKDAESASSDVKATRLDPDTFSIRNPMAAVIDVDVGNKVSATPLIRIESIGETVEGSDGHLVSLLSCQTVTYERNLNDSRR